MMEAFQGLTQSKRFKDLCDQSGLASPIEAEFYRVVSKYLNKDVCLENQVDVQSGKYTFRIDFVVTLGSQRIGFECDGRAFHSFEKDEWRDSSILKTRKFHSIVRLRGTDIAFRIYDALYVLMSWYPEIFEDRAKDNIEQLASVIAKESEFSPNYAHFEYPVEREECDGIFGSLFIYRRY